MCQKTVVKECVSCAWLADMSLIDTPFRRVALDLIAPISPAREMGHRCILTLADYATKYSEAVPLPSIEIETCIRL